MRDIVRTVGCLGAVLASAACGDQSGTSTASSNSAIVSATPTPTPTPTPTATPTITPTPTQSPLSCSSTVTTGVIVQSGDSIGAGFEADWAAIDHLGLLSGVTIHNVSTNGEGLETALGRRATDLFPFYDPRQVSLLLIQQGTNDLGPGSSDTGSFLYALLTSFVSLSKAAGFYVVVDTVLPRQDANWTSAMEQQRLAYNVLVRANGAQADAVNDIASDPVIGDGTNPGTSIYYVDGLHPALPGQQRLAALDSAALGPLLQCPIRSPAQ